MASAKFNIKNIHSNTPTIILMIFYYDNSVFKISTKKSILPKYWNSKKNRVRETMEIQDSIEINNHLDKMDSKINECYFSLINKGLSIDNKILRKHFIDSLNSKELNIKKESFWTHFNTFVEYKKTRIKDIRDYNNSLRKHLENVEVLFSQDLYFDLFKNGTGFIDRMDEYLTYEAINADGTQGLRINTIGKQYKNLKVFLNWCFDRGIAPSFSTKHIVTRTEDVENIYLTKKEIESLEKLNINGDDEKIRDTFLIGCKTGLRYSDYTCISKNQIRDGFLHVNPKKTERNSLNNKIIIPIGNSLDVLLNKYDYCSPIINNLTITEFNKKIRELGELAKINTPITLSKNISGKVQHVTYKKYQLISSHSCRRTFCTLMFLDGMPPAAIMKFSGHKTERSFMKYLKMDSELAAVTYKDFFN